MKKTILFALIAATSCLTAADKRPPLPKDLPAYGPPEPFQSPQVSQSKLPNGLTVWYAPVASVPKVNIALAIKGGFAADPPDKHGLAELLAAALPEGTKAHDAKQIAEAIQDSGGDLNTSAGPESIDLQTSVLTEKADQALKLVAEIAESAAFSDGEVQIVKNNAASALEANEADPRFLGERALYHAVFGSHPYGVINASKGVIQSTTAEDLRAAFAREFSPDRAILVLTGAFNLQQMQASVEKAFATWQKGSVNAVDVPAPSFSATRTVILVPRPKSVQTGFMVGTLSPDPGASDYAASQLANAIYGGMFGSRLVLNIREDKGYTYSPHSRIDPHGKSSLLFTSAEVRNEVTGPAFNEIGYELNRIATTEPEPAEVEEAKRYVTGSLMLRLQTYPGLGSRLASSWIWGLNPSDIGKLADSIQHASAADVRQASAKYFPISRMTVVTVGDEKVIREQLAPFGLEFRKEQ